MQVNVNTQFHGRYLIQEYLGAGSFGEVWKAQDQKTDEIVAIKIFHGEITQANSAQLSREYRETMEVDDSPHIVKPKHYDECDKAAYLILPLCNQSLSARIEEAYSRGNVANKSSAETVPMSGKRRDISTEEYKKILLHIARGLRHLHDNKIIHCDLKPDNVLLTKKGNWALTDFGISKKLRDNLTAQSSRPSTGGALAYASPEILHTPQTATFPTDIFSLGITMYEMATGSLPMSGEYGLRASKENQPPDLNLPTHLGKDLNTLMKACLVYEPSKRPTAKMIVDYMEGKISIQSIATMAELNQIKKTEVPQPPGIWRTALLWLSATVTAILVSHLISPNKPYEPPITETQTTVTNIVGEKLPVGTILSVYLDSAQTPSGWQLCDGSMINDDASPLNGTVTPDLRGKFMRGKTSKETLGKIAGSDMIEGHNHYIESHKHEVGSHYHPFTTDNSSLESFRYCNSSSYGISCENGFSEQRYYIAAKSESELKEKTKHVHNGKTGNASSGYTGTGGGGYTLTNDNQYFVPKYVAINYIMKIK